MAYSTGNNMLWPQAEDHRHLQNGGVEEKPVSICVKLDISPKIIPRDTSLGTKLLILIPPRAKTVREVRSYIANSVLRTPTPFHLFAGDYRIREEEDAIIFSLINEPCRLLPVPMPKPALASTPKLKSSRISDGNSSGSSSQKRVTFFDEESLVASPVFSPENSADGIDAPDHARSHPATSATSRISLIPSPDIIPPYMLPTTSSPSRNRITVVGSSSEFNADEDTRDCSLEKKKKRRRRHRNRKSKIAGQDSEDDTQETDKATIGGSVKGRANNNKVHHPMVFDEETESEEETTPSTITAGECFEFAKPVESTRKRSTSSSTSKSGEESGNVGAAKKKKVCSDSAIESEPDSFASPVSNDSSSNGKVRQDTPIVPRVIKNPRIFESARKILNVHVSEGEESNLNQLPKTDTKVKREASEQPTTQEPTDCYSALPSIASPDDLVVGSVIAFKVLELDERYNPTVSSYKEAMITGRNGSEVELKYTKNETIIRTGKLEFSEMDQDSSEDGANAVFQFSDFLEAKFVQKV